MSFSSRRERTFRPRCEALFVEGDEGARGAREVLHGVGFSGNGVTMSNLAGEILCDIYAGDEARWQGHQWVHRRMEWVPPEPMRWIGYQLFTRVLGYTPRIKPRDT